MTLIHLNEKLNHKVNRQCKEKEKEKIEMEDRRREKDDESGHVYINGKGRQVPGVTTVLGMLNKPSLLGWANWLGTKQVNVDAFLEQRAEIGTDFHFLVENYMTGKSVEGEHFNEAIKLFTKFRDWARCHYYKVYQAEVTLVGESFAGTVDAIGEVDGHFCVVDYKTSKDIHKSQFIQLAGYSLLIKELLPETYEKIEAFGIVTMRCSKYCHKFIPKKELEERFVPVFKNLLQVYWSCKEMDETTYF